MKEQYQITKAAELESLAGFRQFIDTFCDQYPDFQEDFRYDLKLAVDEACTNIITHGYAGMNPGSIILCLKFDADQLVMEITDFGHPFEPNEAAKPDVEAGLENRPMGGFGLFFIYSIMDMVSYETTEAGNRLYLIKKVSPVEDM